ncbi:Wall-associated receptor kinase, galacturonan-binding domain [Sesbania bispinosa]|nr:Wall-associated receptor kinase, galacturonan-binding domain [Sesbania bispinosa]
MFVNFVQIINIILILWLITNNPALQASAQDLIMAKRGCKERCGGVDIPYPFGMNNPKCYADKWFEIECKNRTTPYLKYINLEVTSIDVSEGTVQIMNPIFHRNCEGGDARPVVDLRGGPFVYSQDHNKFIGVGCDSIAFLVSNASQVSGCVSICDDTDNDNDDGTFDSTNCHGKSCCETSLPSYLSEYNATFEDLSRRISNQCSYALISYYNPSRYPFYEYQYQYMHRHRYSVSELKHLKEVSAVLEWEIPNKMLTNSTLKLKFPVDEFSYCYATNVTFSQKRNSSGQRCSCNSGFYGNPYVAGGCIGMIHHHPFCNSNI